MRRKMIFRIGVTLVVFVAVFLYYMIKLEGGDHRYLKDGENEVGVVDTLDMLEEPEREAHLDTVIKDTKGEQLDETSRPIGLENWVGDWVREKFMATFKYRFHHNSAGVEQNPTREFSVEFLLDSDWKGEVMHLSVVACGTPRVEETIVLLKSAILLSRKKLVFHVFAEDDLHKSFTEQLSFWPEDFQKKFRFHIYSITFPAGQNVAEWKKLFKPCASQRLFIPVLLKDVDSILYVDTDILFLRPVDDVWEHFHKFNSSQFAALAPEHEDEQTSWYKRFARHPYYGHLGVNSGVMLMNLTRMREFDWLTHVLKYYQRYKMKITWGDQDVINIIFHFFPERLYTYGCDWNFRPDHCMYMSTCKLAEKAGISVLHGNRGVLHNDKQPTFKAIYQAFNKHRFGDSLQHSLLVKMKRNLEHTHTTNCGKVADIFTKQFEQQVLEWQKIRDEAWNLGQDSVRQV